MKGVTVHYEYKATGWCIILPSVYPFAFKRKDSNLRCSALLARRQTKKYLRCSLAFYRPFNHPNANAESTREIVPRSYSFYKTVGGTGTRTTRNFLLRVRKQKRDEHGASFQSSPNYRKWSIKRRGSYCLFHVKGAALIREWRLFESGAYFNYRYNTEGNIMPRIKWGAYYIHFNIIFFM